MRSLDHRKRLVERRRAGIEIAGPHAVLDPARLAFDGDHAGARHGRRQWLGAAHAAEPAGQDPPARQIAVEMAPPDLAEGLVSTLDDALAADIDP